MNNSPGPESWIRSVPPRRLAAFAGLAALYVGVFTALSLRKMGNYLVDAARTFEFARPWLEWFSK